MRCNVNICIIDVKLHGKLLCFRRALYRQDQSYNKMLFNILREKCAEKKYIPIVVCMYFCSLLFTNKFCFECVIDIQYAYTINHIFETPPAVLKT